MIKEASVWFASWLFGLVALGVVQLFGICTESVAADREAAVYYAPTHTVSTYQDASGEYSIASPNLRLVIAK